MHTLINNVYIPISRYNHEEGGSPCKMLHRKGNKIIADCDFNCRRACKSIYNNYRLVPGLSALVSLSLADCREASSIDKNGNVIHGYMYKVNNIVGVILVC